MKHDDRKPIIPIPRHVFSTIRRRDVPRQVPPYSKYSVIPSGMRYTSDRVPFLDDEE